MRQTNATPALGAEQGRQDPREGWHNVPPVAPDRDKNVGTVGDRQEGKGTNIPPSPAPPVKPEES